MEITSYQERYKNDFAELNLVWIKKYFKVEPEDVEMLYHVENLIAKGAAVFLR